jgi:hypothetical protein
MEEKWVALYLQNRLCSCWNNMGPAKLEKATKLNISILSEDDFIIC